MKQDEWREGIPPRPEPTDPLYQVVTPRWGTDLWVVLLSDRIYCRWLHYDSETRQTPPCSQRADCPYCSTGNGTKLVGWTAVQVAKTQRLAVLQLSESAIRAYEQIPRDPPGLRGVALHLSRQDRRPNSRMVVEVVGRPEVQHLAEPFDPRPTLERLFGERASRRLIVGPRLARRADESPLDLAEGL